MCSIKEFSGFIKEHQIKTVTQHTAKNGDKGFVTILTFVCVEGHQYQVQIRHKKKEDIHVEGCVSKLEKQLKKEVINVEEVRTSDTTTLGFFVDGDANFFELSSTKMISIVYLRTDLTAIQGGSSGRTIPWLGKPKFTAQIVTGRTGASRKKQARMIEVKKPKSKVKPLLIAVK